MQDDFDDTNKWYRLESEYPRADSQGEKGDLVITDFEMSEGQRPGLYLSLRTKGLLRLTAVRRKQYERNVIEHKKVSYAPFAYLYGVIVDGHNRFVGLLRVDRGAENFQPLRRRPDQARALPKVLRIITDR